MSKTSAHRAAVVRRTLRLRRYCSVCSRWVAVVDPRVGEITRRGSWGSGAHIDGEFRCWEHV